MSIQCQMQKPPSLFTDFNITIYYESYSSSLLVKYFFLRNQYGPIGRWLYVCIFKEPIKGTNNSIKMQRLEAKVNIKRHSIDNIPNKYLINTQKYLLPTDFLNHKSPNKQCLEHPMKITKCYLVHHEPVMSDSVTP